VGPHQAKNLARKRGVSFFEVAVKSLLLKDDAKKEPAAHWAAKVFHLQERHFSGRCAVWRGNPGGFLKG
jgi:hypothetical protein